MLKRELPSSIKRAGQRMKEILITVPRKVLSGTVKEWIAHNPNAWITNPNYMPSDYAICGFEFKEKPEEMIGLTFRYPDNWTNQTFQGDGYVNMKDGDHVPFYIHYPCLLIADYGHCGASMGLVDAVANDPNWIEVSW